MTKDTKKEEILAEYKEKFLPESVIPNDPEKKKEAEVIYAILCKSHIDWLSDKLDLYAEQVRMEEKEQLLKEINYETDVVTFRQNEMHIFARSIIDRVKVIQNGKYYEIDLKTYSPKEHPQHD